MSRHSNASRLRALSGLMPEPHHAVGHAQPVGQDPRGLSGRRTRGFREPHA